MHVSSTNPPHLLFLLFSSLLLAASSLRAGVVYSLKNVQINDATAVETTTAYVDGENMRLENPGSSHADGGAVIFQGKNNTMLMVDDKQKQYTTVDEATIDQLAGQMSQLNAQMEAALKNVPASQRAMMEEMMRKQMGRMPNGGTAAQKEPTILTPGPDNKPIDGYSTRHFQEKRNGQLIREYWVADWKKVDGGEAVKDTFETMSSLMEKLVGAISQLSQNPLFGSGISDGIDEGIFQRLKELNGLPISILNYKNGRPTDQTTLESIKEQDLSPSLFTPPQGYKEQKMGMR